MGPREARKRENRLVVLEDGTERDHHGSMPPLVKDRIKYVLYLMATGQWLTGVSDREIAEDWGCSPRRVRDFASEASRRLDHWGDKEEALRYVRQSCVEWIDEADPKDRTKAAELLLKSHGALLERHEVQHVLGGMSDEDVAKQAIKSMIVDDTTRELMRAELAAYDARHALPAARVEVIEVRAIEPEEVE